MTRNNNDHALSFDGTMLGLSGGQPSVVFTVPVAGGTPKQITPVGPSYLHGWSPDGKLLAFTGQRNGDFDVYVVPSGGGPETRLTTAPGLDDGPEFTPDGRWIYFNSTRTGRMQVWRMRPDGSGQEQLTFDDFNNWFPHVSPDGRFIVFITYGPEIVPTTTVDKQVYIRKMPANGGTPTVVAYVYGGQGSLTSTPGAGQQDHRLRRQLGWREVGPLGLSGGVGCEVAEEGDANGSHACQRLHRPDHSADGRGRGAALGPAKAVWDRL